MPAVAVPNFEYTGGIFDAYKFVLANSDLKESDAFGWLCAIEMANVPCHHPVQFRCLTGGRRPERIIGTPWEGCIPNFARVEPITWCEVCGVTCPHPPVDIRKRKRDQLLAVMLGVLALRELDDEWDG